MVGPVQQDSAAARETQWGSVLDGLDDPRTGADGAAAACACAGLGSDGGRERDVWSGEVVPLGPTGYQRGAFSCALSAQRWIRVRSRPNVSRCVRRPPRSRLSARQPQSKAPPAFGLQVRGTYVVQSADPE